MGRGEGVDTIYFGQGIRKKKSRGAETGFKGGGVALGQRPTTWGLLGKLRVNSRTRRCSLGAQRLGEVETLI